MALPGSWTSAAFVLLASLAALLLASAFETTYAAPKASCPPLRIVPSPARIAVGSLGPVPSGLRGGARGQQVVHEVLPRHDVHRLGAGARPGVERHPLDAGAGPGEQRDQLVRS